MFIVRATRSLTAERALRITWPLAVCASLVGVLTCWTEATRPAWAQGDSAATSLSFRVERLEAELHRVGEPTTEVIIRNGDDRGNDLEFDAVLENGENVLRSGAIPSLSLLGDPSEADEPLKAEIDPGKTIADARVFVVNITGLTRWPVDEVDKP